jgi:hypothetical protein
VDLTERQPPKVNLPDPISISKLFPAKAIRQPDGAETRIEQKHQLGRHFVEIRRWRLEGADWTPTPDHVRIGLDAAVRAVEEINGLIRCAQSAQQRFEKIRSSPSVRGNKEVDDLIKLVKKKLKRLHEVNGNLQKKILPGLRAQLEIEATKFMQR